jgi:hypothetical protein
MYVDALRGRCNPVSNISITPIWAQAFAGRVCFWKNNQIFALVLFSVHRIPRSLYFMQ